MSMTVEEFQEDLQNTIAASAMAQGVLTREAAVAELADRLVRAEVLQDWTPCYLQTGIGRGRLFEIDGYSLADLDGDGSIWILSGYFPDSETADPIGTADATKLFNWAEMFLDSAVVGDVKPDASHPAMELLQLLAAGTEVVRKIRVAVLTTASLSSRLKVVEGRQIAGIDTEQQIWGLQRFFDLANEGGREPIDIDMTAFVKRGIPALPAGIGEAGYASYLCVVPGTTLADLYSAFGTRLLEGNVRTFLSVKGGVNKGIRRTIMNEPDRFFAFNNGVTATATEVETADEGGHTYLTRIRDLQIVNGGQTTASLFHAKSRDRANLDKVFVQVKLSVLEPAMAAEMVPLISRYANTQNKVNDADLFANSTFHRRIEEMSRRLWAPPKPGSMQRTHWFYERARAQYDNDQAKLSDAKRRAFLKENPKEQVVTKTDLAKYENTWGCSPQTVSKGAQKNFVALAETLQKTYEEHEDEFNDRWYQNLVAKAVIFHRTEALVSSATWYCGAYRANVVTYAIAALVNAVRRAGRGVVDLDRTWREQAVSPGMVAQLLAFGEAAQEVLVNPPANYKNVTEWAKRPECWAAVAEACTKLLPEFVAELKSASDERSQRTDAKRQGREDIGIAAMTEVSRRAQTGYWRKACDWNAQHKALAGPSAALLEVASNKGRAFVPAEFQAKMLLEASQRLIDAGWLER